MAEYIESKCRKCFNLAPCAAWIKHGTMLYSDFSYSVEGCQYFVSAADVAPVVRCRDCKHYKTVNKSGKALYCARSANIRFPHDGFCSYGERKDGDGNG